MSKVIQEGKVMITTIILGISGLPVLLIMYFVLKGMGKERNHSLFGITLWQDAMKEEGVQEVIRTYKKQLKYWTVFFLVTQIVMYPIKYISIVIMLWLIWLFAMIICMYIPYVKANKKMRLYKAQYQAKNNETPQNLLAEDDENWIWGIFYYNKNDNRFWVNNKLGTGTTVNMAKPGAVVFNVIVIGLTVVISIGAVVLCALDEFVPIKLEYKNGELNASQWKQEYQIEEEDISSVTLLETLPSMSRSSGTSLDNLYKGKWFSRELDRRFKVCLNPEENPFLMIETKDGTWYLLGDESGEQTKEIYEKLNK